MAKPPSLMIAMPCRDIMKSEVWPALAWNGLVDSVVWWRKNFGEDAEVWFWTRSQAHVVAARNEGAELAIVRNYDWILWMDDDAVPPPHLLERLMASGKDWIAPTFTTKKPPYKPCCFRKEQGHMVPIIDLDPPRLFQADATGFHTVLMKVDILRKTQDFIWEKLFPKKTDLFQMDQQISEDLFFCNMARLAGHELWIDSRIEVGHGGDIIVGPKEFRAYRDAMSRALGQAPTAAHYA